MGCVLTEIDEIRRMGPRGYNKYVAEWYNISTSARAIL